VAVHHKIILALQIGRFESGAAVFCGGLGQCVRCLEVPEPPSGRSSFQVCLWRAFAAADRDPAVRERSCLSVIPAQPVGSVTFQVGRRYGFFRTATVLATPKPGEGGRERPPCDVAAFRFGPSLTLGVLKGPPELSRTPTGPYFREWLENTAVRWYT